MTIEELQELINKVEYYRNIQQGISVNNKSFDFYEKAKKLNLILDKLERIMYTTKVDLDNSMLSEGEFEIIRELNK